MTVKNKCPYYLIVVIIFFYNIAYAGDNSNEKWVEAIKQTVDDVGFIAMSDSSKQAVFNQHLIVDVLLGDLSMVDTVSVTYETIHYPKNDVNYIHLSSRDRFASIVLQSQEYNDSTNNQPLIKDYTYKSCFLQWNLQSPSDASFNTRGQLISFLHSLSGKNIPEYITKQLYQTNDSVSIVSFILIRKPNNVFFSDKYELIL